MILNNAIFLQTHLNNEDNKVYEDIIKYLWGDLSSNYIFINTNKKSELKNINSLNRIYNEYCALYYIYENKLYENYNTISLGHYRRIPNIYNINEYKINNDFIQYYESFEFVDGVFMDHVSKDELEKIHLEYEDYYQICEYFMSMHLPLSVCEDMINYLKQQNIIDQNKIIEKLKYLDSIEKTHTFIGRSTFTCNQQMFTNMMKFLNGYLNYLGNKYNYNLFDYNDCIKFINFYIIDYFRSIFDEHLHYHDNLKTSLYKIRIAHFQNIDSFKEIINPETNYGLNTYCNTWRFFGYTLEFFISLFISCNLNFINGSMKSYIITGGKMLSTNTYYKTEIFDKLMDLHLSNIKYINRH